jgi:hypothetical protein
MHQQGPPTEQMPTGSNTPVYQQQQQQQQQQQPPTHNTNSNSFATNVNNASAPDLAQSVALNTGVKASSELADAVPANANGTGNYILSESTDFTFGVQGQPDDLMDFTFDPITTPGNDDMLAAMQAIQNPTWWRTMMMPGSVDRFFSHSYRTYLLRSV